MSGPPGAGKSSFIETLGMQLVNTGHKVAVLAVDPSSARTGGSILGDKTRMVELSRQESAYVRPSPSSGTLGGVTKHTNEAILITEEAGYNIVLIETVGVGQSETAVEGMVDLFVLLANPAAGDELQGIKRGIVEVADLIVVNKADGELANAARQTQMDYMSAIKFVRPKVNSWRPRVMSCSARTGYNVDKVWETMKQFWTYMEANGEITKKRARQREQWMWRLFQDEIEGRLATHAGVQRILPALKDAVLQGTISPTLAAEQLVDSFFTTPR